MDTNESLDIFDVVALVESIVSVEQGLVVPIPPPPLPHTAAEFATTRSTPEQFGTEPRWMEFGRTRGLSRPRSKTLFGGRGPALPVPGKSFSSH
eukprot:scaffold2502_cov362-Prasinococcus_capsulatus_cf.AAC.13